MSKLNKFDMKHMHRTGMTIHFFSAVPFLAGLTTGTWASHSVNGTGGYNYGLWNGCTEGNDTAVDEMNSKAFTFNELPGRKVLVVNIHLRTS